MIDATPVDDLEDPRLADYQGVRDPVLLRERGAFLAEGRLVLQAVLASPGLRLRSLVATPATMAWLSDAQVVLPSNAPVYAVPADVLEAGTGFRFHQGCLAAVDVPAPVAIDDLARGALESEAPLVVLESVSNPDNVGAIFRTASAFGCPGVVLDEGCASPLYRKAVRTSMGSALTLPFHHAGQTGAHIDALREAGVRVAALTPDRDAVSLDAECEVGGSRAVLLGSEGHGLSAVAQQQADVSVRIPMRDGMDSLNVAAAAAIALYRLSAR